LQSKDELFSDFLSKISDWCALKITAKDANRIACVKQSIDSTLSWADGRADSLCSLANPRKLT